MTAIFAFVEDNVAFIAADTKRDAGFGMVTAARKVQSWNDRALIAQTGFGEGLQRLVGEMLASQHRSNELSGPGGAEKAFGLVREFRLAYERHHSESQKFVGGNLIVTELQHLGTPPKISVLDWTTGNASPGNLPVHADGTDRTAFQLIADQEYRRLRPSGVGPLDLGAWAVACITRAKLEPVVGEAVDWPADLAIIRKDQGAWITLRQRFSSGAKLHPAFQIP